MEEIILANIFRTLMSGIVVGVLHVIAYLMLITLCTFCRWRN